MQGCYCTRE